MIKTMKEMEQVNRRLLQEEADQKAAAQSQKQETEQAKALQAETEKTKSIQLEQDAKKDTEQQNQHDVDLQAQTAHQRDLDTAADLQQRNQEATNSGTELAPQANNSGIGKELGIHKPAVHGDEKQNLSWRPGTSMEQRPDDPTYLKTRERIIAEEKLKNADPELAKQNEPDNEMEM
jgi:hypothetical protein